MQFRALLQRFAAALRRPVGAALLSAVFPGLGQAAAGYRRRAAIVAIPALAVIAAFILILIFDRHSILGLAVNQQWLTSLLILDLVGLIYHIWAVADSYLQAGRAGKVGVPRTRTGTRRASSTGPKWAAVLGIGLVVSGTVAVHAAVAATDLQWQHALDCLKAATPCFYDPSGTGPVATADAGGGGDVSVVDTSSPGTSGSSPTPSAAPATTFDLSALPSFETSTDAENWAADGQLNVLLIGADYEAGTSRTGLRPDTMIVLHVDLASGKAAMIGVPRNTVCVPLPQGIAQHYAARNGCPAYTWSGYSSGIASAELNWFANEAWNTPANFPFPQDSDHGWFRGAMATEAAISTLTGLTIDGYVTINISGLATLIDDLGGIDINVPVAVTDYPCGPKGSWAAAWRVCDLNPGSSVLSSRLHGGYNVPGPFSNVQQMIGDAAKSGGFQSISWHGGTSSDGTDIAFLIKPGQQHMDGLWALAYSRSRIYYTDYVRMARQQLVLKSMRTSFDPCTILPKVPGLIQHLGGAFNTNLPIGDAPAWASLAKNIVGGNLKTIVLDPTTTGERYINGYPAVDATSWAKIKNIVAHSLDGVPAASASAGTGGGGGGFGC